MATKATKAAKAENTTTENTSAASAPPSAAIDALVWDVLALQADKPDPKPRLSRRPKTRDVSERGAALALAQKQRDDARILADHAERVSAWYRSLESLIERAEALDPGINASASVADTLVARSRTTGVETVVDVRSLNGRRLASLLRADGI